MTFLKWWASETVYEACSPDLPFNIASLPDPGALRSQRLIQAAFSTNDLLKNLDEGEIRGVIACMHATTIHQDCSIIQEGTSGAQAYVLEGTSSSLPSSSNIHTPLGILINISSEMTGDQEEARRNSRGYLRLYRSSLTYSLIRSGFLWRLSKGDNVRYLRLKK